jgi:outer membrane lipoprotein
MASYKWLSTLLILSVLISACSVMSESTRRTAEPDADFPAILANVSNYKGKTVILGGYILKRHNQVEASIVEVLQTPLMYGDEPRRRDTSQGRFIVRHTGFLDPEVYRPGRRITVAGEVVGTTQQKVDDRPYTYLVLKSREIYLWRTQSRRYDPYGYRWRHYPFYPYPWRPYYPFHPYYPHHPYFW